MTKPSDDEIHEKFAMAVRLYKKGSSLGKKVAEAIAEELESKGVTDDDIDRLFPGLTPKRRAPGEFG